MELHFWPIVTALWIFSTFLISYLIAVLDKHVNWLFPYISDTGTFPPERCIFAQMLNIGAALTVLNVYIRYRTAPMMNHRGYCENYLMWNRWSGLLGIISSLGLSLVANFQQTAEINVHVTGAFLAFVVGSVYCIIQAYLTYLTNSSKTLKVLRIFLSLLMILFYITTTVCSAISFKEFNGKDQFKWSSKDAGFKLHLVATFTEWLMAIALILYMSTFYVEFRSVKLKGICFVLKDS